jgi:hypothetical protein
VHGWTERGLLIAFGAAWVVLTLVAIGAFAVRERPLDRAGVAWFLIARGLPGALFVAAGLTRELALLWAAGVVLVVSLLLGRALRRYFGTGSRL